MKSKLLLAVGIALSLVTTRVEAAPPRPEPGPAHQKLAIWVGKWAIEETSVQSPFGPALKRKYRFAAKPHHRGFVIQGEGKEIGAAKPLTWTEIHYVNGGTMEHGVLYADSDGIATQGVETVQANTWSSTPWEMKLEGKTYRAKSVLTFGADGRSYQYEWTYSEDGVTWKPWVSGVAKKIGKAK